MPKKRTKKKKKVTRQVLSCLKKRETQSKTRGTHAPLTVDQLLLFGCPRKKSEELSIQRGVRGMENRSPLFFFFFLLSNKKNYFSLSPPPPRPLPAIINPNQHQDTRNRKKNSQQHLISHISFTRRAPRRERSPTRSAERPPSPSRGRPARRRPRPSAPSPGRSRASAPGGRPVFF